MQATIHDFSTALAMPDMGFKTLRSLSVERDERGLPAVHRTTAFADALIRYRSKRWMISIPLRKEVMFPVEHTLNSLRNGVLSPILGEMRILGRELQTLEGATADVLLTACPPYSLEEALARVQGAELLRAVDALEDGLLKAGIAHRNLKAKNIRWDGRRLIPIRWYDAAVGGSHALDTKALDALRDEIRAACGGAEATECATEPQADESPEFEGRRLIRNAAGLYGYTDTEGREVISPQYLYAEDFAENRAVVETREGFGVIDRTGREVIPSVYDMIAYHLAESRFEVRLGATTADFDYTGRQLTEFTETPNENEKERV